MSTLTMDREDTYEDTDSVDEVYVALGSEGEIVQLVPAERETLAEAVETLARKIGNTEYVFTRLAGSIRAGTVTGEDAAVVVEDELEDIERAIARLQDAAVELDDAESPPDGYDSEVE